MTVPSAPRPRPVPPRTNPPSAFPPTTTPTASPPAVDQLPASNRSDPAVVGPMTTPPGDSLLHKLNANALLILVEGLIFIVAGLILLNRISARRQAAKRQREQREQLVTFRRMIAEQLKRNYQPQTVAQQSSGAEGAITRQAARLISTGEKQRAAVLVSTIIQNNPNNAEAWYQFSFVVDDLRMRIEALERALYINPGHDRALDRLAKLRPGEDLNALLDITW